MDAGDKLSCPAGQSQERPAQAKWAGGPPIVPALPLGAEIMGEVQGKWLAWPREELASRYNGPCLKRQGPS